MSVQSEIDRINNNVQTTLQTIADTGVSVGSNSDALPAAAAALANEKANAIHTHTKSQITDFPSSMPASDVYSWAKASTKPSYTASEVGAMPTAGGTFTGNVTHNTGTYFNASTYMKHNVFYNAYDSEGNPCCILGVSGDVLYLGSGSYPHPGSTIVRSANEQVGLRAATHIKLCCYDASISDASNKVLAWSTFGYTNGYLRCAVNDGAYIGSSSYKWKSVYAINGTIQTSDRNAKKNIKDVDDRYIKLFDLVRPVTYQLLVGDRIHTGFIAQEVEEAMEQVGLTAEELGFFCKDIKVEVVQGEDGNEYEKEILDENGNPVYIYSLRYEEYIAIMAEKIHRLEARLERLEATLKEETT